MPEASAGFAAAVVSLLLEQMVVSALQLQVQAEQIKQELVQMQHLLQLPGQENSRLLFPILF